jgi:hypothetical protein
MMAIDQLLGQSTEIVNGVLNVFAPMIGLVIGVALISIIAGMLKQALRFPSEETSGESVSKLANDLGVDIPDDMKARLHRIDELEVQVKREAPKPKASKPKLPKKCGSCGAPAQSDYVHWGKNGSASCAYCGSVLVQGD